MKKTVLFIVFLTLIFGCKNDSDTKRLDSYLRSFGVDIKDYKVVCFVPVDGCNSCTMPALDYSKKAGKDFLLVLSSIYTKSIDYVLEAKNIEKSRIVYDSNNLAASVGLVPIVAPCFYLLYKGQVVKIIDSSTNLDKTASINEVIRFLSK